MPPGVPACSGSVPAPIVLRLAMCVRSGADLSARVGAADRCGSLRIGAVMNTSWPFRCGSLGRGERGRLPHGLAASARSPLRARRPRRAPCARAAGRRTPRTGRGRRPDDPPAARSPSCSRESDRVCPGGSAPRSCGSRLATSPSRRRDDSIGMCISLAVRTRRLGTAVFVLDLPPPLVPGDLDAERTRRLDRFN